MVLGTRKMNSNVHPGAILQSNRKPRRTRKQVEEDKVRAAELAKATEEKAAAEYQSALTRVAELRKAVEMNEQDIRAHTLRPDLCAR